MTTPTGRISKLCLRTLDAYISRAETLRLHHDQSAHPQVLSASRPLTIGRREEALYNQYLTHLHGSYTALIAHISHWRLHLPNLSSACHDSCRINLTHKIPRSLDQRLIEHTNFRDSSLLWVMEHCPLS
jgi:hypothetical protein